MHIIMYIYIDIQILAPGLWMQHFLKPTSRSQVSTFFQRIHARPGLPLLGTELCKPKKTERVEDRCGLQVTCAKVCRCTADRLICFHWSRAAPCCRRVFLTSSWSEMLRFGRFLWEKLCWPSGWALRCLKATALGTDHHLISSLKTLVGSTEPTRGNHESFK